MIELIGALVAAFYFFRKLPFSIIMALCLTVALLMFVNNFGIGWTDKTYSTFLNQCSAHSTLESCKQYGMACNGLKEAFQRDHEWYLYRDTMCTSPQDAKNSRLLRSYSLDKMGLFGADCTDTINEIQQEITSYQCDGKSPKPVNPEAWTYYNVGLPWLAGGIVLLVLSYRVVKSN